MTAPLQTTQTAQPRQLTAAQIAALLALVQAQAAVREQLASAAAAAARLAMSGFTAWWDADEVTDMIARVLRVLIGNARAVIGLDIPHPFRRVSPINECR